MNPEIIRAKAVEIARSNIYGEQGANNEGAFIRAMGGVPGEEWCALYGGYCYRRAHQLLGLPPPKWAWRTYPRRLEVGAKALVKAMSRAETLITDPAQLVAGDAIAFHRRTGPISWKGHFALVVGPGLETLEGNVGSFPAMVQSFRYEVRDGRWWRIGRFSTVPVRFAYGAGLR